MAQHDYIIDDSTPALVRQDINAAFLAAVTCNSGPTPPTTLYPCMLWADTSPAQELKIRNIANTDWVVVGKLNQPNLGRALSNLSLTTTGPVWFNNGTGVFNTAVGGAIQRPAPVVSTSPAIYTTYTNFGDNSATPIDSTQGGSILSAAIVPSVSTSSIMIELQATIGLPSTTTGLFHGTLGIFGSANVFTAISLYSFERVITIRASAIHRNHNTTSAITYTVRFGANPSNSGSKEFYLNRAAANPTLGSTAESWIQLTEVA